MFTPEIVIALAVPETGESGTYELRAGRVPPETVDRPRSVTRPDLDTQIDAEASPSRINRLCISIPHEVEERVCARRAAVVRW
jgi:hypothetical protein